MQVHFSLKRTPECFLIRLPQNRCQASKLPRSIRRILKDTTRNFTDDFFNSRPTLFPSALYVIASPPPPPSAHLTLIPAPFAPSLISIGRLRSLSAITQLKLLLHFSRWWGRSAFKDPEQEVLSPDKRYLNLRGEGLVLDSPDNRGLQLRHIILYYIKTANRGLEWLDSCGREPSDVRPSGGARHLACTPVSKKAEEMRRDPSHAAL